MHYEHYSLIDKAKWPFTWFKPVELACNDNGSLFVDEDAVQRLDNLRKLIKKPIFINSAYRNPIYNAKVGGAPMSMHKFGRAFDISLKNHNKFELERLAKQVGFTGFGYYKRFLHIDTGRKRFWGKRWD